VGEIQMLISNDVELRTALYSARSVLKSQQEVDMVDKMKIYLAEYTKKGISLRVQRFRVEIQTQTETRSLMLKTFSVQRHEAES
jgi:hypothetical protein